MYVCFNMLGCIIFYYLYNFYVLVIFSSLILNNCIRDCIKGVVKYK